MVINRSFLFALSSLLFSCTISQYCVESKNYLKKANTSKSYLVEGKYCILKEKSTGNVDCEVVLNVFDRISGQPIEHGTAFFTDSLKFDISSGKVKTSVPPGTYNVGITSFNSLPFSIKDLKLVEGTSIEINCYLGSSLQFKLNLHEITDK